MGAPRLPSIFKHRQAKHFDFKPRFYDERKEQIEKLKKQYEGKELSYSANSFKNKAEQMWKHKRNQSVGASNVRLLVIIAILFLLTYLIITY